MRVGPPVTLRFDVRRVDVTGSTNADVTAVASDGGAEGVVVVADHQTAGRGRSGRRWVAAPSTALLCTVLLRPPARVATLVTTALALAAADAVAETAGVEVGLKWPNDLVVDGPNGTSKLAGLLSEVSWPAGATADGGPRRPDDHERVAVAAGIGLNLRWPPEGPPVLDGAAETNTPVSLAELTATPPTRDALLEALLGALSPRYEDLVAGDVAGVLADARRRSATIGRRVRVVTARRRFDGEARDLRDDGALVVEVDDGGHEVVAAADVIHLRRVDER